MRVGAQLCALSACYDVRVVVVPVAGGSRDTTWAERYASSVAMVVPGEAAELRAGSARLVADAVWRERLARTQPVPPAVTYASPVLAPAVAAAAGEIRSARVHAVRLYVAPLAVALAEQIGAPWSTLDLDDDEVHVFEQEGRHDDAQAFRRILETFGPEFAWLSLAAPEDAARVAERHGLRTAVIPNSVSVRPGAAGRSRRKSGKRVLLFVGNLTYAPNAEAAELLVSEILPRVRSLVDGEIAVELVGAFQTGSPVAALAAHEGVKLRGYVDDLQKAYARADLTVVPLARGTGTRIKLLEALAEGVPVVTTAVGAAGLGAEDGRHLLIAEGADALAAAVARVLGDAGLAAELAREGRSFVERCFSSDVVAAQLRALATALDDEPARREV
jgi:glycosyltransferase involved in cell wall biosynthesis